MRKQKKLIKILSIFVGVLILILFLLILSRFNFFKFTNVFNEPELIIISDDCGVVMGNLIHEIKSKESCEIMCHNECGLINKVFLSVEFNQTENPCYGCNCYCR